MGIFITLEGGEGSGKTTVTEIVSNRLSEEGYKIVRTREPGGIEISEQIRNIILDNKNTNMDGITEALLFAAARRQHVVEKLEPLLKDDNIVISDRFVDSSLVYQGIVRGVGLDKVYDMNKIAMGECIPDLTIVFDLPAEVGQQRISSNKEREVNRLDKEKIDFHKKIREGYLTIASMYKDRIKVIDANRTKEEVAKDMYDLIKLEIEKRR